MIATTNRRASLPMVPHPTLLAMACTDCALASVKYASAILRAFSLCWRMKIRALKARDRAGGAHMPEMQSVMAAMAALLLGLATSFPATAEEPRFRGTERSTIRDRDGYRVGRIDRRPNGDTIIRDRNGFRTGSIDGSTGIIRDNRGFRTGRIDRNR
jgi:hypothetical protein